MMRKKIKLLFVTFLLSSLKDDSEKGKNSNKVKDTED